MGIYEETYTNQLKKLKLNFHICGSREEFIVQAKPGTTNVAYLSTHLQLHTDLPYYDYKPGVNLLHCLVQSESAGGENLLANAFHVANVLKITWPDYFKLLSTVLVNWSDVGEEDGNKFHSIYRAPIIRYIRR
jgi:gamma-butyrobetaine dioxygenase